MELLRRERAPLRDNCLAAAAVEISPLDRTVVPIGNAHVRPVDVFSLKIFESLRKRQTEKSPQPDLSAAFGNCVLFFETRSQLFEVHGDAGARVGWGCSQILHRPGD